MKDNTVVTIEHNTDGMVCHVPDNVSIEELSLIIQAVSHNLKLKQTDKAFAQRKMTGEQFHNEVAGPRQAVQAIRKADEAVGVGTNWKTQEPDLQYSARDASVMQETFHTFASGAKRSEKIEARYDLIPSGPLRRLALRYGLGVQKYGEWNWQKGLPFSDTYNHIVEHLEKHKARVVAEQRGEVLDNSVDDDLAGAAWGIITLMFFQDRGDYRSYDNVKTTVERIARESLEKMRSQDLHKLSIPDTQD